MRRMDRVGMSSSLIFVRDGRTLPYIPVTLAALKALRDTCELPREGGERRSYPHALATYMALLELANRDRSDRVALTQTELGSYAGMSRRAVQRALEDLQAAGLAVMSERRHGQARIENEYTVVEPPVDESAGSRLSGAGVAPDRRSFAGARPSHPSDAQADDGLKEQQEPRERADLSLVPASKPVRYQGKRVPDDITEGAKQLLATFNEAADRDLGARRADGKPSPAVTQIIGAMLARPNVSVEQWEHAVRQTVAHPPSWVDGALSIGHIFGERAAEHALAPPGQAGDSPTIARGDAHIAAVLKQRRGF